MAVIRNSANSVSNDRFGFNVLTSNDVIKQITVRVNSKIYSCKHHKIK